MHSKDMLIDGFPPLKKLKRKEVVLPLTMTEFANFPPSTDAQTPGAKRTSSGGKMRKRVIVKNNDPEWNEQLNFITGFLKCRPEDFFHDLVPVHFNNLKKMIERGLKDQVEAEKNQVSLPPEVASEPTA